MIFEKVSQILMNELGVDEDLITPDANVMDDLGADSLDVVTLLMAFEEEFGLTIDDGEAENFKTVGDIVSYIEANS